MTDAKSPGQCPFCKKPYTRTIGWLHVQVLCDHCGARGPIGTKSTAIEDWESHQRAYAEMIAALKNTLCRCSLGEAKCPRCAALAKAEGR